MANPAVNNRKPIIRRQFRRLNLRGIENEESTIRDPKSKILLVLAFLAFTVTVPRWLAARSAKRSVPDHVPPKRSSQIQDGFGINSDLPRDPYLPWNRWWWTRMFDAGVKWIRIGQYENSSDQTSWDWVEQKRGVYSVSPEVDDYVDSLVENGVKIQVQLLYGNPMYTSPAGRLADSILPKPGSFHNADRSVDSIFWPPRTPEQISAFINYTKWIVNHFRGRIRYYALWNEQDNDPDSTYWNRQANPEEYGRLLKAFIPAVHESDPEAKVIYGGQDPANREFARRALDTCQCAAGIDVFAYHTYPGYGENQNPETMDSDHDSTRALRQMIRNYPGTRLDLEFWDDEFNSIPSWKGSDESVQAKYVPRGILYTWAAGVKTFVWLLAAGTDGNEYDDFGIIHGLTYSPDEFTPRPVYYALQNTDALFSDTIFDPSIEIAGPDLFATEGKGGPFLAYGFRSRAGKAIVAYWLAAHSQPGSAFPTLHGTLTLKNTGITKPVLIDVVSGAISPLEWKKGTADTLESIPFRDSVLAIADESYFDWPVLPEAPSSLNVAVAGDSVKLSWEVHGGNPTGIIVERRIDGHGKWERIAKLPASATEYSDATVERGQPVSYRVRAVKEAGESAYSNIARATL